MEIQRIKRLKIKELIKKLIKYTAVQKLLIYKIPNNEFFP